MQNVGNLFEEKQVRALWDDTAGKWWFSAVDICSVLINRDYDVARIYWKDLKHRLANDGSQLVDIFDQLKLKSRDGKMRFADVLDIKQIFYLIQVIPKKETDPFKIWLAEAAADGSAMAQFVALAQQNAEKTLDEVRRDNEKVVDRVTFVRRVLFNET